MEDLPSDLQKLLARGTWQPIYIGRSDNQVFRIVCPDGPVYYLKIADTPFGQPLLVEKERLDWLQGRLPVPVVYACSQQSKHTYLLLSEIRGLIACDTIFAHNVPQLVHLVAKGLRMIHQIDYVDCPFNQRTAHKIAQARQRVERGVVDESAFSKKRNGMHADALFKQLIKSQPQDKEDLVFAHGDYCLPNILIDQSHSHVTGFIDWERAGVADRYHDLALAAYSLTRNFGPGWEPLLWEEYGIETVNYAKVEFYQLLEEFF